MDNLSRFYIDIATDANKMSAFNSAEKALRIQMLQDAGVEGAEELLVQDEEGLRKILASSLVEATGAWHGIETNAGNEGDNRSNSPFFKRIQSH